ncbi:MAG: DUF2793 domain-containing protein [Pseudomonadota bacterium]
MGETVKLGLPLVEASQAQKHVTVNEALARVDTLTQLTFVSRSVGAAPIDETDGAAYWVPAGATGAWEGRDGRVALWLNQGWTYLTPATGWRAWIADEGAPAMFDGVDWLTGTGSVSPNGAAMTMRVIEIDHPVGAGASSVTVPVIPAQTLVFGVTGRVVAEITGTATAWRLGIGSASDDRYGSGLGLVADSWVRGLTSSPLAYYEDTALTLTAEGGDFAGGTVRLAVHVAELALPRG